MYLIVINGIMYVKKKRIVIKGSNNVILEKMKQ